MPNNNLFFTLPYVSQLLGPVKPNHKLVVKGQVPPGASRFSINLTADHVHEKHETIPLHVNFRFDENVLVLNSYNNKWEAEVRFPNILSMGEPIELGIFVNAQNYEIFLKDQYIGSFNHRNPLSDVKFVKIQGDFSLFSASWQNQEFRTPFVTNFVKPLTNGQQVQFCGTARNNFFVNFAIDENNISFHYNPRFTENKVVRNNFTANKWGTEEREGDFKYVKGKPFQLVFKLQPNDIQVYKDGKLDTTFKHRGSISSFNKLEIEGDVLISSLDILN